MDIQHVPIAETAMLIRKPVSEVFEAFVNPAITSKFWFTKGSGRLEAGKQVRWDWEMYGHSVQSLGRPVPRAPSGARLGHVVACHEVAGPDQRTGRSGWHLGGFFGLAFLPAFRWLLYVGAASLVIAVVLAGVGLVRRPSGGG
jgi:hypothetical protein